MSTKMTPEEQELSNAIRDRYRTHRDKRSRGGMWMLVLGLGFMAAIPAVGVIMSVYMIVVPDTPLMMLDVIPYQILMFGVGFMLISGFLVGD